MTPACMIVYTFVTISGYAGYNAVVPNFPDQQSCERFQSEIVSKHGYGFNNTRTWCVETCK